MPTGIIAFASAGAEAAHRKNTRDNTFFVHKRMRCTCGCQMKAADFKRFGVCRKCFDAGRKQ